MSFHTAPSIAEERFHLRWIDAAYADAAPGTPICGFLHAEVLEWPSAANRRAAEVLKSAGAFADSVEVEQERYLSTKGVWTTIKIIEWTASDKRQWASAPVFHGDFSHLSCKKV
jgi:hypothetical protein